MFLGGLFNRHSARPRQPASASYGTVKVSLVFFLVCFFTNIQRLLQLQRRKRFLHRVVVVSEAGNGEVFLG